MHFIEPKVHISKSLKPIYISVFQISFSELTGHKTGKR